MSAAIRDQGSGIRVGDQGLDHEVSTTYLRSKTFLCGLCVLSGKAMHKSQ